MMQLLTDLLGEIARYVLQARGDFVTRVAVDGADGAGKTRFADSLAHRLDALGVGVIRASVDGFHNPRAVRYRRGRYSPEGFYFDSYDYPALKRSLLDPLSPGGAGEYVSAVFDHVTDRRVAGDPRLAWPGDVLLFDGIFTHRPELRGYWDVSLYLEVDPITSIDRLAKRDGIPRDADSPLVKRYVEGQALYRLRCSPMERAAFVIDNRKLDAPALLRGPQGSRPARTSRRATGPE